MKKLVLIFLVSAFLFPSEVLFPQQLVNAITGYVKDKNSGEPLMGANVFLSNTLWGTTSDKEGYFAIKQLPPSNYEIVCSIIGYDPLKEFVVVKSNMRTNVNFFLEEKIYEFDDVTVKAEEPDVWLKQMEIFRKYFLGRKYFADNCVIENEYDISFKETEDYFYAFCDKQIRIRNNALGYVLECVLFSYEFNKNTWELKYVMKPKFTEMIPVDSVEHDDWLWNREEAYYGSLRDFLAQLVNDELPYGDFALIKVRKDRLTGSDRATSSFGKVAFYHSEESLMQFLDSTLSYDSLTTEYVFTTDQPVYVDYHGYKSSFLLPAGKVELNSYGYPQSVLSINVFGDWASYGAAEMLPELYELKFRNNME